MPNLAVIEIHDLDSQGRGVGRGNGGKVVFVDGALPGDTVEVELTVEKKSFDLGVLKKIVTPSPSRRKSPCPHSAWDLERSCGACHLL